jgi:acetyltransferase-like isoleucine patch superfamily enzyme
MGDNYLMVILGKHSSTAEPIDHYEKITVTVGNFTTIGSGLKIYSGRHPSVEKPEIVANFPFKEIWGADYPASNMGKDVKIGNDVWVATDVRILEGVTIGDGAILGAGAVIGSDVPPYSIAIGNPWKILRKRFDDDIIQALLEIQWWNWEDEAIKESLPFMINIHSFL